MEHIGVKLFIPYVNASARDEAFIRIKKWNTLESNSLSPM